MKLDLVSFSLPWIIGKMKTFSSEMAEYFFTTYIGSEFASEQDPLPEDDPGRGIDGKIFLLHEFFTYPKLNFRRLQRVPDDHKRTRRVHQGRFPTSNMERRRPAD
jgi:hypothetical protein